MICARLAIEPAKAIRLSEIFHTRAKQNSSPVFLGLTVTISFLHSYYVNVKLYAHRRRGHMSNSEFTGRRHDCTLLFFILVFLLLFYDNSAVGILKRGEFGVNTCSRDDSLLFFILVFLKLFYC